MTFTNRQRADRFATNLNAYSDDEPYINLGDCLADAMHWCHLNDHEFEDALDTARMHLDAELLEDAMDGGNV